MLHRKRMISECKYIEMCPFNHLVMDTWAPVVLSDTFVLRARVSITPYDTLMVMMAVYFVSTDRLIWMKKPVYSLVMKCFTKVQVTFRKARNTYKPKVTVSQVFSPVQRTPPPCDTFNDLQWSVCSTDKILMLNKKCTCLRLCKWLSKSRTNTPTVTLAQTLRR